MNRKLELAETEVDNPFFSTDHPEGAGNPRKVRAFVNVRESALIELANRGALNPHQLRAGFRFGKTWEIMEGVHGGSFGDYVDSRYQPSISDDVVEAGRELKRCRQLLGRHLYWLVEEVCGKGNSLPALFPVKRQRLTAADNLRTALDDMAVAYGYMVHHKVVDTGNRLGR
jgi:hypothetical protein